MSLRDAMIAARRLMLLRLLAECDGELNEAVIRSALRRSGFGLASADDVRSDLDHLAEAGCLTPRWEGRLRVVTLTERGDDTAHGRVAIDGVEHAPWRRA
ncbi:MAG TPA: hypothetical protein VKS60_03130 [Stellaceae bacterium]|nr:hypothetical protein [Stellaceae bacterium]